MRKSVMSKPAYLLAAMLMFLLIAAVNRVNAQAANTTEAYTAKGVEYYQAGQYKKAIEAFKRAINLDPNAAEAHYHLGDAYFISNQPKEAVKSYKHAIELKPDYLIVYNNMGTAYHRLGDFKAAVDAYKVALRLAPDYTQARYGLGIAYLELKETENALEQHKLLSKLDPERADKLFKYIDDQRSLKVLNGQALSKPAPLYPPIAKAAHASGVVPVWIVVDETGKVVQASAVSGHPLLRSAAVTAAYEARFTPTTVNGQPVKVTGLITYAFVLQERLGPGLPPP